LQKIDTEGFFYNPDAKRKIPQRKKEDEMISNILNQVPLMERTNNFIKSYGLKVLWIAEKTNIPNRYLSSWLNGNAILYAPQLERLTAFLNEYEQCMSGFSYTKDGDSLCR